LKHQPLVLPPRTIFIGAHPDDETLFAGAAIQMFKSPHTLIMSITHKTDSERGREFQAVADRFGIQAEMCGHQDNWFNHLPPSIEEQIRYTISLFDAIVTHNPFGEYGHKHHVLTSYFVTNVVRALGKIDGLYYFGANCPTNRVLKLSDAEVQYKLETLKLYTSQDGTLRKAIAGERPFKGCEVTNRERFLKVTGWV
jgi:LmbE family N-acetylglucosaminyl deacetylase